MHSLKSSLIKVYHCFLLFPTSLSTAGSCGPGISAPVLRHRPRKHFFWNLIHFPKHCLTSWSLHGSAVHANRVTLSILGSLAPADSCLPPGTTPGPPLSLICHKDTHHTQTPRRAFALHRWVPPSAITPIHILTEALTLASITSSLVLYSSCLIAGKHAHNVCQLMSPGCLQVKQSCQFPLHDSSLNI